MMSTTHVDVTPHPRILGVLGEIEFKPWQCIAELIDNSVDGFLKMHRNGIPITDPVVHVAFGRETVLVKDNGPGMSVKLLESAVKAGWTGNEAFGNLGLYGLGFNIATARLGSVTRIWTTQTGDNVWYGLEIDLQKLAQGTTYLLPIHTREKSDRNDSGTEVEVSNIKADWSANLSNNTWVKNNISDRLSRVYSTMLRQNNAQPIKFSLLVNDRKVSAYEHCVWPADTTVFRKNEGLVRPVQVIDLTYGTKYLSRITGEMFDEIPEGASDEDIVEIPERVYGWLGIQRYTDDSDFGIDILRNGRKIEVASKDLFNWETSEGKVVLEYPIDDPRQRGRIVGEIHLDHGYVHYTKHRFEREHSSWKQLLCAVRDNEPLIKREDQGYAGVNRSKLGLLFRVFRRNSPQASQTYREYLILPDNEKAKSWANEYRKGNQGYRDDKRWIDEIDRADKSRHEEKKTNQGGSGFQKTGDEHGIVGSGEGTIPNEPIDIFNDGLDDTDSSENQSVGAMPMSQDVENGKSTVTEPIRTLIPELTFRVIGVGISGKTYEVETYAVESSSIAAVLPPWQSRLTGRGVFEVEVNLHHPAFDATSMRVRDGVLADLANFITSEERDSLGVRDQISYADILLSLRTKYASSDSLGVSDLRTEIDALRRHIVQCLTTKLEPRQHESLLQELGSDDMKGIRLAQAQRPGSSPLEFVEMGHLAQIFSRCSQEFFDGGCFVQPWVPDALADNPDLLSQYQKSLAQDLWILMVKMGEFTSQLGHPVQLTRANLELVRACVNQMAEYVGEWQVHG